MFFATIYTKFPNTVAYPAISFQSEDKILIYFAYSQKYDLYHNPAKYISFLII